MIVCHACGARNPDDEEFCATCGRYLEWAGEHVELPAPTGDATEPEPELEAPPGPLGFFRRVAHRLGLGRETEAPEDVDMTGWRAAAARREAEVRRAGAPEATAPAMQVSLHHSANGAENHLVLAGHRSSGGSAVSHGSVVAGSNGAHAAAAPEIGRSSIPNGVSAETEEAAAVTAEFARVPGAGEHERIAGADGDTLVVSGLSSARTAPVAAGQAPALRRPGDPPPSDRSEGSDRSERGTVLRRPTEAPRPERGRPVARRAGPTVLPTLPDDPAPGDVFCRRCDQFNAPSRVFCRRCGERLPHLDENVAYAYQPIPFVRRHRHRDAKIVAVGERPGVWGKRASGGGHSGRSMAIMSRVGGVVIGVALVLSFIGPAATPIRHWYQSTWDHLVNKVNVQYTQQFAIGADASTSYPNHPAGSAVDDASNTYWQSLPSKKAKGAAQSVTAVFASKTNVDRIGILSGAGPSQSAFLSESRPEEVLLTFSNGYSIKEHLQDEMSFQRLAVRAVGVSSMTLKVLTVYPSATGNSVAITELEFYERS